VPLFVILRAMGKRELSQLTAFELVLLVTIGDVVQQGSPRRTCPSPVRVGGGDHGVPGGRHGGGG